MWQQIVVPQQQTIKQPAIYNQCESASTLTFSLLQGGGSIEAIQRIRRNYLTNRAIARVAEALHLTITRKVSSWPLVCKNIAQHLVGPVSLSLESTCGVLNMAMSLVQFFMSVCILSWLLGCFKALNYITAYLFIAVTYIAAMYNIVTLCIFSMYKSRQPHLVSNGTNSLYYSSATWPLSEVCLCLYVKVQ